jgi:integration host factor subunit beta
MTRSELIAQLSSQFPQLTSTDIDLSVRAILDEMSRAVAGGHRIEIRGFGSFCLNHRPPRKGHNPKTGEKVMVPAKYVPHFKTGKALRECVDAAAVVESM